MLFSALLRFSDRQGSGGQNLYPWLGPWAGQEATPATRGDRPAGLNPAGSSVRSRRRLSETAFRVFSPRSQREHGAG